MYLPPAASWEAGSARWPRRLVVLLLALAGLLDASFCLDQRWGASSLTLLLVLGLCMAGTLAGLQRTAKGVLRWDGEHWYWLTDTQQHAVAQVDGVVDWQRLLLLRIECADGKRLWLWLESTAMDRAWLSMRRAVVAAQVAPAPSPPGPLPD